MNDSILSSIKSAPVSDFIYSSMSFFASRRGGELPGPWFVRAIGGIGVDEQAIRQSLFRLERTGVIVSRREGRMKWYRAARVTEGVLAAGRARVATPPAKKWDHCWTVVHLRADDDKRHERERLRDILLVEGFGSPGPGFYLHPWDRTDRLLSAAEETGLESSINIFRGTHVAGASLDKLAHDLWNVSDLVKRYNRFIRRYEAISRKPASHWSSSEAFALRFAFMNEFFRITWDDPSLPRELFRQGWPVAEKARNIADTLMKKLLPGAIAHADAVLSEVLGHH